MLIEAVIKLSAKILIVLVGCAVSLTHVLPWFGSYNYAISGVCTGIVAATVLAFRLAIYDLIEPTIRDFGLILGGAALAGVFWPVAVVVGLWLWFIKSGGFGGGARTPGDGLDPASSTSRALNSRRSVNKLIKPLPSIAPANACLAGTPITIIGGAIISVRKMVQPASAKPEPFSCSSTRAAVR